jgi:hypothetical protein
MLSVDTFLTTLYVMVDDFCHSYPPKTNPGPEASLSESEVITLAIFARWNRFASERDFYRYAKANLRDAFPTLPDCSQFNRLARSHIELIEAVALHLVWRSWRREDVPTKPWRTAPRCPLGTPSEGVVDGWPDRPTRRMV